MLSIGLAFFDRIIYSEVLIYKVSYLNEKLIGMKPYKMFSQTLLQGVADEQLNLYMDWLLEIISRCESEADSDAEEIRNEVFHRVKQRTLHQEVKRHSKELRREKKRRLHWWCH